MNKQQAQELLEAFAVANREKEKIFTDLHGCNYPLEIKQFFDLIARADWLDHQYESGRDMKRLRDPSYVSNSSLEPLCSMLTAAWRGERYFDGLWKSLFVGGQLERVMRRLAAIFQLDPHIT